MIERETKLLKILEKLDFSRRYYNYYDTNCRGHKRKEEFSKETVQKAIIATKLPFTYDKKENFYRYEQPLANGLIGLNIWVGYSSLELILDIRVEGERLGGPFPSLAREAARLNDEFFEFAPRYPRLDCANENELKNALEVGLGLFRDIAKVVGEAEWTVR